MALKIAQMIVNDISHQTGCEVDLDPSLPRSQSRSFIKFNYSILEPGRNGIKNSSDDRERHLTTDRV